MKINKNTLQRFIFALTGDIICCFFCGLYSATQIGMPDLNVFATGMAKILHITLGQMTTIYSVVLLIISFLIDRKKIGIMTLISVFLNQYPIDIARSLYRPITFYPLKLIFAVICMLIMFFGAAMMMAADVGVTIYDAFTLGITDRFHFPYLYVRWASDLSFLLVGFILGGDVGVGTVICFIIVGKVISFYREFLKEHVHFSE